MEVACTSTIHAVAPHFLWPFAVQSAQPLAPSQPETSPTLFWMGAVGDASAFRVWDSLALSVILPRASSLLALFAVSSLTFPPTRLTGSFTTQPRPALCPPVASPLTSYPPVDPLPPPRPAPSGVSQVTPPPLVEPLEVSSDTSGSAEGGDPAADDTAASRRPPRLETLFCLGRAGSGGAGSGDADSGGAGSRGAGSGGADSKGAGSWVADFEGVVLGGAERPSGGGVEGTIAGVSTAGGTGAGGAGGSGAGGAGGVGAGGAGGHGAGGTGGSGVGGAGAESAGGSNSGGS
ncbi:unnamed protein product [Closterium sp. NIES-54]